MKPNTMYVISVILVMLLGLGLLFSWSTLTGNIHDYFIASIGLLTFISIFYGFTVSSGRQLLIDVKKELEDKKNKLVNRELKKIIKSKDKKNVTAQLKNVKIDVEDIEGMIHYLNLNVFLFIAVLSFLFSTVLYLVSQPWATVGQVITFWIGVLASLLIVSSWFVANSLHSKNNK